MVSILLLPLAVLGACGAGAAGSHKHSQNLAHYHNHRHHWKHPEPHHTATVTNVAVIHKTHIHPPPITHTAEYVHPHVPHYEPYVPAHPQPYAPTYSQAYEQPYATPHAAPHAQPYVQPYAQPYVQPYAQPYVQTHTKAYVRPYTQTHAQAHVQPYRAPHHHKHAYTYAPEPYIQTTTRDAYPYAAPTPNATVNGQSAYNPQSYASAEVVVSFATAHWPGYADAAPAGHSAITVTYSAQPEPIPTYKSRAQGVVPTTVPPEKIAEDGPAPVGPVSWHPPGEGPATPPGPGPIDADISALVSRLSLREKIGQMAVLPVNVLLDAAGGLSAAAVEYWVGTWSVGAFFSAPGNGINGTRPWYSAQALSDYTDAVQRVALERGANKIPVIWGLDSVRGANFVRGAAMFPSGVGTAATFDPRFAYAAARVAAKDTRAAGYHWSFAPVLDVSVNKLWSRVY
ncbi:hypothetical protein H4R18_005417 [Coemansia javaensis]|uniref:beta-glucosidase n=1 Tax=Coemansia javaensis TaxID=2761396 RepID=A0A9W8LEU8_9FUNG|nr:hypothetical protein H4R18_005417 [Coemansia javaensis]